MGLKNFLFAAAVVAVGTFNAVNGHLFFEDPAPRGCFYGGYYGFGGDGPWRTNPCEREAGEPTKTYAAGQKVCLTVHEFVPHPGHYRIALVDKAVQPGDEDVPWIVLEDNIKDENADDLTGMQAFYVQIPANITCKNCTIQVRQWADDFQWYYYTCADVEIVASGSDKSAFPDAKQEDCVWTAAGPRLRMQILQTMLIFSLILLAILSILIWCCFAVRSGKKLANVDFQATPDADLEGSEHAVENGETHEQPKPQSNPKRGCMANLKAGYAHHKRSLLIISAFFVIVIGIIVPIVLSKLKSCSW